MLSALLADPMARKNELVWRQIVSVTLQNAVFLAAIRRPHTFQGCPKRHSDANLRRECHYSMIDTNVHLNARFKYVR